MQIKKLDAFATAVSGDQHAINKNVPQVQTLSMDTEMKLVGIVQVVVSATTLKVPAAALVVSLEHVVNIRLLYFNMNNENISY
jgi:hypothetical protein